MANSNPKYPDVVVQLSGEDGNIFFITARVTRALRKAGVSIEEQKTFQNEVTSQHSYDAALQVCMRWVECE